jgi:hypothetical protein
MAELKENILNILEEKGIMDNFKSQLRAQVLKAMDEFSGKTKSLQKPETLERLDNQDAQVCLEIIWDFLEYYKLKNTLEIFLPECNLKRRSTREELEYKSGLRSEIGKPLLLNMLEKSRLFDKSPEQSIEMPPSKFPRKSNPKIPEMISGYSPDRKAAVVAKPEQIKPVEKASNPLTTLPKPSDKNNDRLKLQPLSTKKKITDFKSFDVLIEEKGPKIEDSPKSSIEEDIDEEIEEDHKEFYESQGTSSMGVDASVNSLALEDFDHIENIRPPKRY